MKYTLLRREKSMKLIKQLITTLNQIWSIDIADMIDYKISNNKGFRYIFILTDSFSKYLWAIPLKNKYSQTHKRIFKYFFNLKSKTS